MVGNTQSQNSSSVLRRVISLLSGSRRTFISLFFVVLVASGIDIAVPFLTRQVIDRLVDSLKHSSASTLKTLVTSASFIFLATVVTRALRSVYNYRLFKAVGKIEDQIKTAAFANFLRLDTAFHTRANSGEIIGSLDRGGTAIFVILFEVIGQNLVPPMIVFTGVLVVLLSKSPWIALAVFLPVPIYLLIVGRLTARMNLLEHEISRGFETVSKESYDIASNVATVKKFSQELRETETQRRLIAKARVPQWRGERTWAYVENVQTVIAAAGRVAVLALGAAFVLNGKCSIGECVLFIALQDLVYGPINQLSILLPKLRRNAARAQGLFEVLDQYPAIKDKPNATPLKPLQRSIEFRNVSFRYGNGRWALKNVSFKVQAGSTVALIGKSGTGKSTLVNLLLRCYDPQLGAILIDSVDIRSVTQESLRQQIAVVPQEVDLFSRTVTENIAYGSQSADPDEIVRAARLALADDFIRRTEHGYQSQVGERGLSLSGGERQRLGIARAILRDPRILILDEATSHLDAESEQKIQQATEELSEGRTCFIIAHRLSTVRNADMVIVFGENGIEAIGTHSDLWSASPTYKTLYSLNMDLAPDERMPELEEAKVA